MIGNGIGLVNGFDCLFVGMKWMFVNGLFGVLVCVVMKISVVFVVYRVVVCVCWKVIIWLFILLVVFGVMIGRVCW